MESGSRSPRLRAGEIVRMELEPFEVIVARRPSRNRVREAAEKADGKRPSGRLRSPRFRIICPPLLPRGIPSCRGHAAVNNQVFCIDECGKAQEKHPFHNIRGDARAPCGIAARHPPASKSRTFPYQSSRG